MVGIRKPRVLPVPVRACAMLEQIRMRIRSFHSEDLHILTLQCLVDSHGLHLRHCMMAHSSRDRIDDIGVHKIVLNKLVELRDLTIARL